MLELPLDLYESLNKKFISCGEFRVDLKTYNLEEFFIESIGAKGQRPPVTTYRKQRVIEHRIHYRTLHNTR